MTSVGKVVPGAESPAEAGLRPPQVPTPQAWPVNGRGSLALLALVLSLQAAVLCHDITGPFTGLHDWQSAFMSAAGRNHLRYGYTVTRLAVVENADLVRPEWFQYYTDHPPLVPVLVSWSFRLFGEHEWSARLVPAVLTLGSTILIYLLGTAQGGTRLGLVAALIFAMVPMNGYFGRMVSHEAPTSFFALATALAYFVWHRTRRPIVFAGALGAFILGALCGWPAYYLGGILPLHHLATAGREREWKVILLPLTALMLFALHLADIFWLQGPAGLGHLGSMFLFRTKLRLSSSLQTLGVTPAAVTFGWKEFVFKEVGQAAYLFTPMVLVLAALAVADLVWRKRGGSLSDPLFAGALLLFGLTHVLLFPQAAWQHEYMMFYCSAPLAILAAGGTLSLVRPGAEPRVLGVLGLVFLLTSLPTTRSLFRLHNQAIVQLAPLVAQHTRPGEQVITNAGGIYGEAPQIGYYAGRDVSYSPVFDSIQLQIRLDAVPTRPFAVIVAENEQGQQELSSWLTGRYPSESADLLDVRCRIFHVPGRVAS